tara:strand:- start:21 stop:1055 length:1035 start_codon:yes stop_codon:yes gene_type:complete
MENINQTRKSIKRRILITGATSGIGYASIKRLVNQGHELIVPCRNKSSFNKIVQKIKIDVKKEILDKNLVKYYIMDLSDLDSVLEFTNQIQVKYDNIDILALNAGLQYTGSISPRKSVQGFELTFATNHLAHVLLTHLLFPLIKKSKQPRIVITSSEVHNPNSSGGQIGQPAGLKEMKGILKLDEFTMIDGISSFSADKAYKDSKLCNILFAKELSYRLKLLKINIPIITWAPGLVIPRSRDGFFRHSRKYNEIGQRVFAFLARDVFRISESTEKAGELLEKLLLDDQYDKPGFNFYSNLNYGFNYRRFIESDISEEAKIPEISNILWEATCNILKIDDYFHEN